MKHRILKKFVKAYRPYGNDRKGIRIGMKEEGHCKYWHRGSIVRWWTRKGVNRKKYVRKHPGTVIWI